MDIEVITTKKKLTKSIINQMRVHHPISIDEVDALGILRNCHKGLSLVILCKDKDGYFLMNAKPIGDGNRVVTHAVRGFRQIITPPNAFDWVNKVRKMARELPQIYL